MMITTEEIVREIVENNMSVDVNEDMRGGTATFSITVDLPEHRTPVYRHNGMEEHVGATVLSRKLLSLMADILNSASKDDIGDITITTTNTLRHVEDTIGEAWDEVMWNDIKSDKLRTLLWDATDDLSRMISREEDHYLNYPVL